MCDRCDKLSDEVAWLKAELGMQVASTDVEAVKQALGISPMCARIVMILYHAKGRVVSCEHLEATLPRHNRNDELAVAYIKAQVCNTRRVAGDDFITTAWSLGFSLPPASIARVSEIISGHQQVAA